MGRFYNSARLDEILRLFPWHSQDPTGLRNSARSRPAVSGHANRNGGDLIDVIDSDGGLVAYVAGERSEQGSRPTYHVL
jgi:hypothetical protein